MLQTMKKTIFLLFLILLPVTTAEILNNSDYILDINVIGGGGVLSNVDYESNIAIQDIVGIVNNSDYTLCVGLFCTVDLKDKVPEEEEIEVIELVVRGAGGDFTQEMETEAEIQAYKKLYSKIRYQRDIFFMILALSAVVIVLGLGRRRKIRQRKK